MVDYPSAQGLMAGPLGGWLAEQAQVRAAAKAQARRRLRGAALVLVPLWLLGMVLAEGEWDDMIYLGFFLAAAAYGWAQRPVMAAKKVVKGGINSAVASSLGLVYTQDCEAGDEFAAAQAYGLFPAYDKAAFEDRWEGAVSGHAFSLHEVHLREWQGSGKSRRLETVFRGSVLRIAFAQSFHGTTLVTREGRFDRVFLGKRDEVELGGEILQAAPMVSPDFEAVFDVYTTDPVEARWIVHPIYIEKLVAIEDAFAGEKIAALFTGGAVVIVLACGNLFESGTIDPEEDAAKLDETIAQFQRLADLALTLNTVKH